MAQSVSGKGVKVYKIFVDDLEIYSGSFEEIPERFRSDVIEAFDEWGTVLTGRNLNEMIYSLLYWYEEKYFRCMECEKSFEDKKDRCVFCDGELKEFYKYEHNPKLTRIMECVGMITHAEIEQMR